jgi:hypothetical protein
LYLDEPGVYLVDIDIALEKQNGEIVHGDVVGSGDGQVYYFALPEDGPRVFASPLPAMSRATDRDRVVVPLRWNPAVQNPRLTWSVMTPGALYDEGTMEMEGSSYEFVWRPRQSQIQLPNYDTVDIGTGQQLLTDIVVFVFFFEGELDGEPVYDAIRVAMRGDILLNPDALGSPNALRGAGGFVGDPPPVQAQYPAPSYTKQRDLDGLRVMHGGGQDAYGHGVEVNDRVH